MDHLRRRFAALFWFALVAFTATPGRASAARTYGISGRVDGPVVSGVTVTLSCWFLITTTTTDARGAFAFAGLPPGDYALTPSLPGWEFSPASRTVTIVKTSVGQLTFTSAPQTFRISGTVAGAATAGVTLALSGDATTVATTDAAGRYAFAGLSSGTYAVTPTTCGHAFSPASRSVTVAAADVTGQDFAATALGYTISGKVSGAAAADQKITLTAAPNASTTITTGLDGSYAFTAITGGTYTLTPSTWWFDSMVAFLPPSRSVTVACGDVTGQDFTAVDAEWASWPVASVAPGPSDYAVDAAKGTVTDHVTGLLWQRNVDPYSLSGWHGARDYCERLSLGGHSSGWRLPTLIELESLLDVGRWDPTIETSIFPNTPSGTFWTSTPYLGAPSYAWVVNFFTGTTWSAGTIASNEAWPRCVRSGSERAPGPEGRWAIGPETVTDLATGLVWQRVADANGRWFADAQARCESLSLGGLATGWRLPTIKELQTLVDPRAYRPAIDRTAFPDTPAGCFWSSTPYTYYPWDFFGLYFDRGETSRATSADACLVRCVR